jgi:hypothetical protein
MRGCDVGAAGASGVAVCEYRRLERYLQSQIRFVEIQDIKRGLVW